MLFSSFFSFFFFDTSPHFSLTIRRLGVVEPSSRSGESLYYNRYQLQRAIEKRWRNLSVSDLSYFPFCCWHQEHTSLQDDELFLLLSTGRQRIFLVLTPHFPLAFRNRKVTLQTGATWTVYRLETRAVAPSMTMIPRVRVLRKEGRCLVAKFLRQGWELEWRVKENATFVFWTEIANSCLKCWEN